MKKNILFILLLFLMACGSGKDGGAPPSDIKNNPNQEPIVAARYELSDLFLAAKNSDLEKIQLISASKTVDLNGFINQETAILHAARYGQYLAVDELLKQGAFVHIPDFDGKENVFSYLFKDDNTPVEYLKYLKNSNIKIINSLDLFNFAIEKQKLAHLSLLLEMYSDDGEMMPDNLQKKLDKHLIIVAMEMDDLYLAEMFIKKGANVNILNNNGLSVLTIAALNFDFKYAELLFKYNVKSYQKDFEGKTALIRATIAGNVEAVKYLISKKLDKKIKDHSGKNACDYAKDIENKKDKTEIKKTLNCFPWNIL